MLPELSLRLTLVTVSVSLAAILIIQRIIKISNKYKFFKKLGIDGPKPWMFLGNLPDIFIKQDFRKRDQEWAKYGPIFGIFFGSQPQFVITDPEVIVQICIKDSDVFTDHFNADELMNKIQRKFLVALKGEEWKHVRGLISPTFSTGRIRRMYQLIEECGRDLELNLLEKFSGSSDSRYITVNIKDLFNLYTMDAITSSFYGIRVKRAGLTTIESAASRDDIVKMAHDSFKFSKLGAFLVYLLPMKINQILNIEPFPLKYSIPLANLVRSLIKKRREAPGKYDDFLQSIIDATRDEREEAESDHDLSPMDSPKSSAKHEPLTDDMIISQGIVMIAAGLETTGNLLVRCSYILAFHQDIQEKLHQELIRLGKLDQQANTYVLEYDDISSCKYLESVLMETMRVMPVAPWTNRVSKRDYHIEKYNLTIPKGSVVNVAGSAVSKNPQYWQDPEKFDPERFMPENADKIIPGSYLPFGMGPRFCIGKRFALLEAKLAISKMVTRFKLLPAPGATYKVDFDTMNRLVNPIIRCELRNFDKLEQ